MRRKFSDQKELSDSQGAQRDSASDAPETAGNSLSEVIYPDVDATPQTYSAKSKTAKQEQREQKPRDWRKAFTVWEAILAGLGLLILGAQTWILYRQEITMRDSVTRQTEAIQQTNTAIGQTRQLIEQQDKALGYTKTQTDATVKSAEAAQTSAEATVEGAQIAARGLYFGNRPYIGSGNITASNLEDGKIPEFSVTLKNTGNIPARDLRAILQMEPRTDPLPPRPAYGTSVQQSQAVLPSGEAMTISVRNPVPIKAGDMNIIKTRRQILYLYGFVTYRDELSTKCHVLRFCTLYNPDSGRFDLCGYYNREEDQPKCPKPD